MEIKPIPDEWNIFIDISNYTDYTDYTDYILSSYAGRTRVCEPSPNAE